MVATKTHALLSFPFLATCTNLSNIQYIHSTSKFDDPLIQIAGIVSSINVGSALEKKSFSETNTTNYQ